jgi:hypothetical protein
LSVTGWVYYVGGPKAGLLLNGAPEYSGIVFTDPTPSLYVLNGDVMATVDGDVPVAEYIGQRLPLGQDDEGPAN